MGTATYWLAIGCVGVVACAAPIADGAPAESSQVGKADGQPSAQDDDVVASDGESLCSQLDLVERPLHCREVPIYLRGADDTEDAIYAPGTAQVRTDSRVTIPWTCGATARVTSCPAGTTHVQMRRPTQNSIEFRCSRQESTEGIEEYEQPTARCTNFPVSIADVEVETTIRRSGDVPWYDAVEVDPLEAPTTRLFCGTEELDPVICPEGTTHFTGLSPDGILFSGSCVEWLDTEGTAPPLLCDGE